MICLAPYRICGWHGSRWHGNAFFRKTLVAGVAISVVAGFAEAQRSIRTVCRTARPLRLNPAGAQEASAPCCCAVSNKASKKDESKIRSANVQGTAAGW